tara:strand:+ start:5781 stop:6713 length:933 start_codon:yes stop_codon:yes gene_type:complete
MKKKLLICDAKNYSPALIRKLSLSYTVVKKNFKNQKEFINFLADNKNSVYVIFITIGFYIDDKLVKKNQKNLKYIVSPTTGTEHINILTKNIKIITLLNIRSKIQNIKSTSEFTWGLIISLCRGIYEASKYFKSKDYLRENYLGNDLNGKTILIIGFGRIGKHINDYAKVFGLKVLKYDKKYKQTKAKLYQLLRLADIVTIHMSLNKFSKNFFDKKCFKNMKINSYFINTSRGEIVDEKQLLHYLKNRIIKAAALDVINNEIKERRNMTNKLINYANNNDNLILTPHIGGATHESFFKTRLSLINYFLNE